MAKRKKRDLAKDLAEYEKSRLQSDLNSVESLVNCCLISNPKQREKAIAEILAQNAELQKLLDDNPKLLISQVEQSLLKKANGYTVTETTKKISNGRIFTETKTKYIPPNQKAIEYFLNNRAATKWSRTPSSDDSDALSKLDEILKGVKENAADHNAK